MPRSPVRDSKRTPRRQDHLNPRAFKTSQRQPKAGPRPLQEMPHDAHKTTPRKAQELPKDCQDRDRECQDHVSSKGCVEKLWRLRISTLLHHSVATRQGANTKNGLHPVVPAGPGPWSCKRPRSQTGVHIVSCRKFCRAFPSTRL